MACNEFKLNNIIILYFNYADIIMKHDGLFWVMTHDRLVCRRDGATVSISEDKLKECETLLKNIKQVWPQYDIDGPRNIWIVKPGDKSKGIGSYWMGLV